MKSIREKLAVKMKAFLIDVQKRIDEKKGKTKDVKKEETVKSTKQEPQVETQPAETLQ